MSRLFRPEAININEVNRSIHWKSATGLKLMREIIIHEETHLDLGFLLQGYRRI